MKIKLTEQGQEQELYSSPIHTRANYRISDFPYSSNLRDFSINELRFNGINFLSIKLEAERSPTIEINYSQPGYWVCFVQEGVCKILEGENHYCVLVDHYTCQSLSDSATIRLGSSNKLLFITIDLERIQGLTILDKKPRKLLPLMNDVLFEIRQCTEDCPIQCIFIESKILSLLYMVFEELQNEDMQTKNNLPIGLSYKDIQKLRAAKVYIVQNIAKNYTLIELAHEVGLNDFKLKKGFKELFGSTVFTYRHTIRMEKAKDMLQSGFQVNEVSEEVGYKHPHHFSAAFKEYFDILPSMIKVKSGLHLTRDYLN